MTAASFKLTQRQEEANRLLGGPQLHTMLAGGSRSGKISISVIDNLLYDLYPIVPFVLFFQQVLLRYWCSDVPAPAVHTSIDITAWPTRCCRLCRASRQQWNLPVT